MTTHYLHLHLDSKNDEMRARKPIEVLPGSEHFANLEGSLNGDGISHSIVLDLDGDHEYRPSSTPGHGHLIIHTKMAKVDFFDLLQVLADYGVISEQWLAHAMDEGQAFVRSRGVYKPPGAPSSEDSQVMRQMSIAEFM